MTGLMVRPAAEADVDELAAFIARDSEEQAFRFFRAVEARYRDIQQRPERWPVYPAIDHPRLAELRRCRVAGFRSYLIFYRAGPDLVEVIRVIHGARDIQSLLAALDE